MYKFIIAVCLSLWSSLSLAQNNESVCNKTEIIADYLLSKHNEYPQITGISDDKRLVIYMNKDGSTWTIAVSKGDISCVVMVGEKLKLIGKAI